ncbi:hypothetical protein Nepgr_018107 [Nepenthes gracilis]|uniref:Homeobox domain-containing protein n=1 Tax=Nepenthes gracilis TaxID=150966 RepID=A0AAD3SU55_NEPGR|nr:hypothetical protein Nepgr_018107 [Nepenthes gracilis]
MAAYFTIPNDQRNDTSTADQRESPTSYLGGPLPSSSMVYYMNFPPSSGSDCNGMAWNYQQNSDCVDISPAGVSDSAPPKQEILCNIDSSRIRMHDFHRWGGNTMLSTHGQGLSLSLGTQIPSQIQEFCVGYHNPDPGFSFLGSNSSTFFDGGIPKGASGDHETCDSNQMRNAGYLLHGETADSPQYATSNMRRIIPDSKYLKAAQQVLDEVVNIGKAFKQLKSEKNPEEVDVVSNIGNEMCPTDGDQSKSKHTMKANGLSSAERQDLQTKLMKLLTLLDQIDRKYNQYYHKMLAVVSSFDSVVGSGAARPYTALSVQTISCRFRCLRDAISGQIRVTRKTLGEQETSGSKGDDGITRLRYVDQQLRQQQAHQQLGIMRQHTWRPQRGLPESAVSILRAWLFEHFLHPYPNECQKIMLARQTGLTRSQVSNWFINARVRLWKPMVEEIYKEEAGNAEMSSNSSSENAATGATEDDHTLPSNVSGEDVISPPTQRCHPQQLQLNSNSLDVADVVMAGPTAAAFDWGKDGNRNAMPENEMLKFSEEQITAGVGVGMSGSDVFQGIIFPV